MQTIWMDWLAAVFSHPDLPGAFAIAAKTTIVYLFLVIGLRLLGKRELGQMVVYDLILIVVIANAVQNAMVGQDTTLGGGLVAGLTLLLLNRAFTWFVLKRARIRHWLLGEPVLIVRDGHLIESALRKEGVTRDEVMASMREHGVDKLENVQMAVLEEDGTISIVPKGAQVSRTRRHLRGIRVP